jgi:hypothetical protein
MRTMLPLALIASLLLAACEVSDPHRDLLATGASSKASNTTWPASTQDTAVSWFGVYDPETRIENSADPLYGRLEGNAWVADSNWSEADEMRVGRAFPLGRPLAGLDSTGQPVLVVLDSFPRPTGDLYVGAFAAHVQPAADSVGPILFWTGSIAPRLIRPVPVSLTPDISATLARVADSLFQRALTEHEPMEGTPGIAVRDVHAFAVPGADSLIAVRTSAEISEGEGSDADHRGGIFMVLSSDARQVRYARFGHPEWSPHATTVRDITPILFFTIPGDQRILMFSTYWGPWESNGYGILDFATGHPLAH